MSLLNNLETRLNYFGGKKQQDRMVQDKLRSLKKSLLYSYQAVTIILQNGDEYRALLNINKEKNQSEYSILSVPFEDICLNNIIEGKTSENLSKIDLTAGSVFTCKNTNEKWLLCFIHSQEKAYLRADVVLCNAEITINNIHYNIHITGHDVTGIDWISKNDIEATKPNYDLEIIITKDENTNKFFKRYQKIYLLNKTWEVQVVSRNKGSNLLFISLKENYNNPYDISTQNNLIIEEEPLNVSFCKQGKNRIKPYDIETYIIKDENQNKNGHFNIIDLKNIILTKELKNNLITIQAATGKHGSFILQYIVENEILFEEEIIIDRA